MRDDVETSEVTVSGDLAVTERDGQTAQLLLLSKARRNRASELRNSRKPE